LAGGLQGARPIVMWEALMRQRDAVTSASMWNGNLSVVFSTME
jgi:hypothetical protein